MAKNNHDENSMPLGLVPLVMAAYAAAGPNIAEAQQQCDKSPIAIVGNSHFAWMSEHSNNYRIDTRNLWFDDHDPKTDINNGCRDDDSCDLYSFEAANLGDIERRLDRTIKRMQQTGSYRMVIAEGTNSLSSPHEHIEKRLKRIVAYAHDPAKNRTGKRLRVYIAEIPLGVIGSASFLTKENVNWYNKMIKKVGSDGVIRIKNAPWDDGELHGYNKHTFPFLMYRFHRSLNIGCGWDRLTYPSERPYRNNNSNHRSNGN